MRFGAIGRATVVISCVALAAACSGSPAPSAPSPTGASAPAEALHAPEDVVFADDGSMYVSEYEGDDVVRIDTDGAVEVIAGSGSDGYAGDGGPAVEAELSAPGGILFDDAGGLVVADHHNGCIRTIDPSGIIGRTWGACGDVGFSGDGGPAVDAQMNDPIGIAVDRKGRLWIADEQNGRIRRIDPDGTITTIAGGGSMDPASAPPNTPGTRLALSNTSYVVVDPEGTVYFSDFLENLVMKIDRRGRVTRVAGTGEAGFAGDGGPATEAELNFPTGLALDAEGNLYISDADNNRVRTVDRAGIITTVAGTGAPGAAGDGGPATEAQLDAPAGLVFDPEGRLVIADQGNDLIRMVDRSGVITTIAGVAP
jgi:sugar lactone lactonase YvrE